MQVLSTYRPLDFTEPEESVSEEEAVTAVEEADEEDNMGTCAQRIPLETGNLKYGDIA